VYRRAPALRAALETLAPSDLSIEDMIAKLDRVVYVSVEDEIARIDRSLTTFFNINTEDDMIRAEEILRQLN
jgi:molybdopterin-guanine dinucleotide biosynthesis protein A